MDEPKATTSPLKAIKAKCLDCCCGQANEVKLCTHSKCALFPFRQGKSPNRKKIQYTDEQIEAARERMKNMRKTIEEKRKEAKANEADETES